MFKLLMAVILGLFLVSAPGGFSPAYAQAVAVCTGTLTFPWGGSNDYEFRLVFSRWDGKLIVKGDSESFQFLNDGSATVHAITGQVFVSPKDKKAVQQKKWGSGIKGFAMGSPSYFTAVLFGGDDRYPGGSVLYPYTLVFNGDKPHKPLTLGTLRQGIKTVQDGIGTCR